ncbi:MAG TPA: hypothetical protein PKM65_20460 [Spirochaetota bacterium]|nr:hypothetical protein [Spirochaetota bacterium]
MKVDILFDDLSGCAGNTLVAGAGVNHRTIRHVDEGQIYALLGGKDYKRFIDGDYEFDVPEAKFWSLFGKRR